jgi:hypothetical protein
VAEFPFVFLNHGELGIGAVGSIWIGFDEPLTADHLQWMIDTCPEPLAGTFYADEALFYCESDSPFDDAVFRVYGDDNDATPVVATRFAVAFEEWASEVHHWTPIGFLIGPATGLMPSMRSRRVVASRWATWSEHRMPDVFEWLEDYLDTVEMIQPATEYDARVDEDWPALAMNRLTLSFIVDRLPGLDVEDLRIRLEDY